MSNEQLRALEQRAVEAETRYATTTIENSLSDAAKSADTFNPTQVVDLLRGKTKLINDTVIVDVNEPHFETGEMITVQLTPAEAIERLRKDNCNLFKQNVAPEIVGTATGNIDFKKMTPQQYRKLRQENPQALGLRPKS